VALVVHHGLVLSVYRLDGWDTGGSVSSGVAPPMCGGRPTRGTHGRPVYLAIRDDTPRGLVTEEDAPGCYVDNFQSAYINVIRGLGRT
jgi:hypothetical protein